jgi:hypothetical protein
LTYLESADIVAIAARRAAKAASVRNSQEQASRTARHNKRLDIAFARTRQSDPDEKHLL